MTEQPPADPRRHTCFFTCCTRDYERFLVLHAFCVLFHNDDAIVEVGVENAARYSTAHAASLGVIKDVFGSGTLVVRDIEFRDYFPNTLRFVTEPLTRATYVYIGDIDILTMEGGITQAHLDHMARAGLPYSNAIRDTPADKPRRLTGLHFAPYDTMYPLPSLDGINLRTTNDEHVLYDLICRKRLPLPAVGEFFRPVHGIHVSNNRPPFGGVVRGQQLPGWGMSVWREQFKALRQDARFARLMETLDVTEFALVQILDSLFKR